MKINILNDIPLDMPFFLPEEIEWFDKCFTIEDGTLIAQSSDVVEEAVNWMTHILSAASMGKAIWRDDGEYVDIWMEA